jgi:hypothetical protein
MMALSGKFLAQLVNPNDWPRTVTVNPHPHLLFGRQSLGVDDTLPCGRADPPRRRLSGRPSRA